VPSFASGLPTVERLLRISRLLVSNLVVHFLTMLLLLFLGSSVFNIRSAILGDIERFMVLVNDSVKTNPHFTVAPHKILQGFTSSHRICSSTAYKYADRHQLQDSRPQPLSRLTGTYYPDKLKRYPRPPVCACPSNTGRD